MLVVGRQLLRKSNKKFLVVHVEFSNKLTDFFSCTDSQSRCRKHVGRLPLSKSLTQPHLLKVELQRFCFMI